LRVQNDLHQPLILEVFDQVPAGLTFEQLPQRLRLSPAEYGEIGYRLKAVRRGRYEFNHCEVRLSSPLGLWRSRRIIPLHAQTRVYPDFTRLHGAPLMAVEDRKSTRLNSSHVKISYAVFCLKKKNNHRRI